MSGDTAPVIGLLDRYEELEASDDPLRDTAWEQRLDKRATRMKEYSPWRSRYACAGCGHSANAHRRPGRTCSGCSCPRYDYLGQDSGVVTDAQT